MFYHVTPEFYRETLSRLCDSVGASNYFSGSVFFSAGDTDCRLTASAIVYRRVERAPEGVSYPITDLMPVWWEFHTSGPDGEMSNDFSFNEMRNYLSDGC